LNNDEPISGHLDRVGQRIEGWVHHPGERQVACRLGHWETRVTASLFRADVRDAGYGDGFCGFSIDIPESLQDGQFHPLSLVIPACPDFRFSAVPDQVLLGIPPFEIRLLQPGDTEAYRHFWVTHLAMEAGYEASGESIRLDTADGTLLVLWAHDRIAGFCKLEPKALNGYRHVIVLRIALLKPYRYKGLGRHLLDAGVDWARTHGFRRIELTLNTNNLVARKLYDRSGFTQEGLLVAHYFDGQHYADEWIMARILRGDD